MFSPPAINDQVPYIPILWFCSRWNARVLEQQQQPPSDDKWPTNQSPAFVPPPSLTPSLSQINKEQRQSSLTRWHLSQLLQLKLVIFYLNIHIISWKKKIIKTIISRSNLPQIHGLLWKLLLNLRRKRKLLFTSLLTLLNPAHPALPRHEYHQLTAPPLYSMYAPDTAKRRGAGTITSD